LGQRCCSALGTALPSSVFPRRAQLSQKKTVSKKPFQKNRFKSATLSRENEIFFTSELGFIACSEPPTPPLSSARHRFRYLLCTLTPPLVSPGQRKFNCTNWEPIPARHHVRFASLGTTTSDRSLCPSALPPTAEHAYWCVGGVGKDVGGEPLPFCSET